MQLADIRVERVVGDHVDDLAVLDHIMAVRQRRGKAKVLLHQEDGEALLLQRADEGADLLHDDRGQTLGRLVQQQELGAGPEDAADGEHLLLAAGQLGALAFAPLGEVGEDGVDLVDAHAARLHHRRQQQILLDREAGEDAALLRAPGDAAPRDVVGGEADELLPAEHDRAAPLRDDAHDRLQGGGLADAVAPQQRHHLALGDGEVHAVQDVRLAVPGVQVGDAQQLPLPYCHVRHGRFPYRPRAPRRSWTPRCSCLRPGCARASAR